MNGDARQDQIRLKSARAVGNDLKPLLSATEEPEDIPPSPLRHQTTKSRPFLRASSYFFHTIMRGT